MTQAPLSSAGAHHVPGELGPLCRKKEHFRPAIDTIGVQHELTNGLP